MNDLIVFVITFAIAIALVHLINRIYLIRAKKRMHLPKNIDIPLPKDEKPNDKIISIKNLPFDEVKTAVQDFTNQYQDKETIKYRPISKLYQTPDNQTFITFPFDIDFEIYCYLVNALVYFKENKKHHDDIFAWVTLKSSYEWITDNLNNQRIMIFIDKKDTQYDNVNFVTETGETYKIGFSADEGLINIKTKLIAFEKPKQEEKDILKYYSIIIK